MAASKRSGPSLPVAARGELGVDLTDRVSAAFPHESISPRLEEPGANVQSTFNEPTGSPSELAAHQCPVIEQVA